jgi:hypothetical protein
MKNSQKGFVVPLVIAIVVLVLGGSYVYYKTNNSSVSTQSKVQAEMINLPLARNGQYYNSKILSLPSFTKIELVDSNLPDNFTVKYMEIQNPCVSTTASCPSDNGFRLIGQTDKEGEYHFTVRVNGSDDHKFSIEFANDVTKYNSPLTPKAPAVPPKTEPTPVISSISQSSGPIGTVIELKGTNLAGFEGDLDATIENSKGETAFLPGIGSVPRADQTIRVKIEGQLCKSNNGYSGLPCTSYLAITPGTYKIYTAPWGKVSNKVQFVVTTPALTSNWKTYTNTKYNFSFEYPYDWSVCSNSAPSVEYVRVSNNCSSSQNNLADYFMVRNIGDLDLGNLQAGALKSDTDWNGFVGNDSMRSVYYQSNNINLVLVATVASKQDILNKIQSTFKFIIVNSNSQPSITVLSPNGGENWQVGSTQSIRWTAPTDLTNMTIEIHKYVPECYSNGMYICPAPLPTAPPTIATNVANTGEYKWVVGSSLVYGGTVAPGQYNISVVGSKANTSAISDSSDNYFTITN